MRPFRQVDVFAAEPLRGNPVAVVHDAEGLTGAQMARFARWTNLSETTFLLPPTTDEADYRLRIFTPAEELPFAGHPTLGSAHAWLEAGGVPRVEGEVVQECGAGLVRLRREPRLAFAAPPLMRSGPVTLEQRETVAAALRLPADELLDVQWIDNGPGWVGALLADAETVLRVHPDWSAFGGLEVGIVGVHPHPAPGGPADRGARVLPEPGRRRGPRDRQSQRRYRPVAQRQRHPSAVVRRLAGILRRTRWAGAHRDRRRHGLGRRRRHARSWWASASCRPGAE